MAKDFGVVYSLTRTAQYEKELWYSINQLKKFHPCWPVTVFYSGSLDKKLNGVHLVKVELKNPFISKVEAILNSPYKTALFIDTDVVLLKPTIDIKIMLGEADICLPERPKMNWKSNKLESLYTRRHSTGMILFKNTPVVASFFTDWLDKVNQHQKNKENLTSKYGDQPLFNNLVQEKKRLGLLDVNIGTIDNKIFNVIAPVYHSLTRKEREMVSYIHCHKFYKRSVRMAFKSTIFSRLILSLKLIQS